MALNFGILDTSMPGKIATSFQTGMQNEQTRQNQLIQQTQANKLAELQYQSAMQNQQNELAEQESWKAAGGDLSKVQQELMTRGLGKQAMAVQTQMQQQQVAQLTKAKTVYDLTKSATGAVMSNPTLATANAALDRLAQNAGVDVSQYKAELQQIGENPEAVYRWAASHSVDADKLLPKFQHFDQGGAVVTGTVDPLTGKFISGKSYKKSMTPGQAEANRLAEAGRAPRTQQVTLSDSSLGIINMDTGAITSATLGGAPIKGKDPTKTAVSEQQAAYNIGRVLTAASQINEIGKKDAEAIKPGAGEALADSIGMSGTANLARNANRQIVFGAQRDALDALLYLATGAAYNKEQLEGQMAAYIPAFTDKPEAVKAKRERMTDLIQSAKARAGKAWTPEMDKAMTSLISPKAVSGKITPSAPAAATGPSVGVIQDGYKFKGGNPADSKNWEKQ